MTPDPARMEPLELAPGHGAWAKALAPLFQTDDDGLGRFAAAPFASGLRLEMQGPEQTLRRTVEARRSHGWDHVAIWRQRSGSATLTGPHGTLRAGPGDILTLDLRSSFDLVCALLDAAVIILPRWVLYDPDIVWTGRRLDAKGGLARLVALQLAAIEEHEAEDEHAAKDALLALLATAERPPETTRTRIDKAIRAAMARPELDSIELARSCGLSRSALYRALEPEGGVTRAILDVRLGEALTRLAGHDRPDVATVAAATGFRGRLAFSRAFAARFGVSPRTARAELYGGNDPRLHRHLDRLRNL